MTEIKWGLNDTAKADSRILRVSIARNKIILKSFERHVQIWQFIGVDSKRINL